MYSMKLNKAQLSGDALGAEGEASQGGEIRDCRVQRAPHGMPICLMNDDHCQYALPCGNECAHPNVALVAGRDDAPGEAGNAVYTFPMTVGKRRPG